MPKTEGSSDDKAPHIRSTGIVDRGPAMCCCSGSPMPYVSFFPEDGGACRVARLMQGCAEPCR
jgi:hypothetical protein